MFIKLKILLGQRHFTVDRAMDKYVNKCKKIYLVGYWAKYGIREYSLEKYIGFMPYIWNYDDHNGCFEEYNLIPIEMATTGQIFNWTESKSEAEDIVKRLIEIEGK